VVILLQRISHAFVLANAGKNILEALGKKPLIVPFFSQPDPFITDSPALPVGSPRQ